MMAWLVLKRVIRLYIATFVIVLPTVCLTLNLHHSVYYKLLMWFTHSRHTPFNQLQVDSELLNKLLADNNQRVNAALLTLNNQRVNSALLTLNATSQQISRIISSDTDTTVLITVISSGRQFVVDNTLQFAPQYVTQNVARFLELIATHDAEHGRLSSKAVKSIKHKLCVCSVGDVMTMEEHSLTKYVNVVRPNKHLQTVVTFGPFHDSLAWQFEREKRDYVSCLQTVTAVKADYLLLVEDDALPYSDALNVIDRLLTNDWCASRTEYCTGVNTYIKLYHPVRLHSYLCSDVESIVHLLATCLLLGTILYVVVRHQSVSLKAWTHCCVYCCIVVVCLGRQHVDVTWRHVLSPHVHYTVADKHCCTQSILYSQHTATQLVDYLTTVHCNDTYHKDDALWDFQLLGNPARLVRPNLFQHIGVWSAVRNNFIDPHLILE